MSRAILVTVTVIWMIVIFMFSNAPGEESSDMSNSFINNTIVTIIRLFNKDVDGEKIARTISTPIRKLAHFTEYLILGVLMFATFKSFGIENVWIPIGVCMLYAISDEIHQYFVPERACRLLDVIIDSLGSITGAYLLTLIIKMFNK